MRATMNVPPRHGRTELKTTGKINYDLPDLADIVGWSSAKLAQFLRRLGLCTGRGPLRAKTAYVERGFFLPTYTKNGGLSFAITETGADFITRKVIAAT
jgi:hypothetical protein